MKRDYKRLPIERFGEALIACGDLDPIYLALHKSELPPDQLSRWLVAYWCLYHAGAASYLSDTPDEHFWDRLYEAALNSGTAPTADGRWPRGAERRHWRGAQATSSALALKERGLTPEALVSWLACDDMEQLAPIPFENVRERVLSLRGYGDWISFKVGDMIDRLGIRPVDFDTAQVFMFADPRKAALMLAKERLNLPESAKLKDEQRAINEVVNHLTTHFRGTSAPPLHDRDVGLQEVETVLCKWKSHMNGHYPVGKDIREIREGLQPWVMLSPTAALFLHNMPESNLKPSSKDE